MPSLQGQLCQIFTATSIYQINFIVIVVIPLVAHAADTPTLNAGDTAWY